MGTEHDSASLDPVGTATATAEHTHPASDVNVRAIVLVGVGLAALALIVQVALWFQLQELWTARRAEMPPPSPVAEALPAAPPEPRLQISPADDLNALRAAEDAELHGYGWVDRKAGVVRIPIERAMELVAAEAGR